MWCNNYLSFNCLATEEKVFAKLQMLSQHSLLTVQLIFSQFSVYSRRNWRQEAKIKSMKFQRREIMGSTKTHIEKLENTLLVINNCIHFDTSMLFTRALYGRIIDSYRKKVQYFLIMKKQQNAHTLPLFFDKW